MSFSVSTQRLGLCGVALSLFLAGWPGGPGRGPLAGRQHSPSTGPVAPQAVLTGVNGRISPLSSRTALSNTAVAATQALGPHNVARPNGDLLGE